MVQCGFNVHCIILPFDPLNVLLLSFALVRIIHRVQRMQQFLIGRRIERHLIKSMSKANCGSDIPVFFGVLRYTPKLVCHIFTHCVYRPSEVLGSWVWEYIWRHNSH